MFETYFRFLETPFGVTPDPRFFYTNPFYQETFAALVYGLQAKKGLVLVTGEVGTGKTTLLRKLMRNGEANVQCLFISNSRLSFEELLARIAHDLGLTNKGKTKLEMIQELNDYLIQQLKRGHIVALLIDEAHNLSHEALEGLCVLSNLETDEEKLLQIVLTGQPELEAKLNQSSLRQLTQRIAIRYRLSALQTMSELGDYIHHRLKVAGYEGPEIFTKQAIETIWALSLGTPRLINMICDNALLIAYKASQKIVSADMIMEAGRVREIDVPRAPARIPSQNENGTDATRAEIKKEGQLEGSSLPVSGAPLSKNHVFSDIWRLSRLERPQIRPEPDTVSPQIFDRMTRALTEAMGPMAQLVLRDQISALGESREAFPKTKLAKLVESISREILNTGMRDRFNDLMFQEIAAFNTP